MTTPVTQLRVAHNAHVARRRPAKSPRQQRDWTPSQITAAEASAANGNLKQATAVCEWLLSDDAVSGALGVRVEALLGLPVSIKPNPVDGPAAGGVVASTLRADWPECYPEPELVEFLKWGILLGLAPGRHHVSIDPITQRWLPRAEFWVPQSLRRDIDTGQWFITDGAGETHELVPGDGSWLLHTPYGESRPTFHGLWRQLSRWALIKQVAKSDWARAGEIGARLVASTPLDRDGNAPPTAVAQRRDIVDEIYAAGGEMVVALPPGWDLSLLEISASTLEIYNSQIQAANHAIRVRIRGGDLSSDASGGGSYAAAESQAEASEAPTRRYDGQALSRTLVAQSIPTWLRYNIAASVRPPDISYPPPPPPAPTLAETSSAVAVLAGAGAELDVALLQADYGLPFLTGFSPAAAVPRFAAVGPQLSGAGAPETRAAVGQAERDAESYIAHLTTEATVAATAAGEDFAAQLMRIVATSASPSEVAARVAAAFESYGAAELADVIEKALILGDMAGRYAAVNEI